MAFKLLINAINFDKCTFSGVPTKSRPRSPKCVMVSTLCSGSKETLMTKNSYRPAREVHADVTHSMPPQKIEVFKAMEDWAENNILIHLKPVEKCWQPQDFLPNPASDGFHDQLTELRERCKEIPDDYFVAIVGEMITEEALPTYQTMLNTIDGVRDESGVSLTPWAIWTRAWTAEENRHGDLLNKYLYLSGRVDMKQIEKTIQYLIGSGMHPKTENNPYKGFIYTSFQERATFIGHTTTARLAKGHGDLKLAQICGTIAADEKRHETAYTKIVEKLFEIDADETMLAFADMMRKKISMPAHLMYDGRDDNLFEHFSVVAQRLGVYTARDYTDILEHLIGRWKVANLTGLSAEGRKAQEYVCTLPQRFRNLEERAQIKAMRTPKIPFSWIYDREVSAVTTKWTYEANKAFENALAENKLEFPDIFHKIALIIPGKTIEEVKEHYEALIEDVEMIESGSFPLPNYKDDGDDPTLDMGGRPKSRHQQKKRAIRWTKEEHEKFLVGLEKYGKGDWKSISRNCVVTKNPTQVASHAQKYYIRLQKSLVKASLVVHSPIQTSNHLPFSSHFQL